MLDIKEMATKNRAAEAAAKKPRFIPRAERLKMEKEAKEREEDEFKRKEEERKEKARQIWEKKNSSGNEVPTGPRAMRPTEDRNERYDTHDRSDRRNDRREDRRVDRNDRSNGNKDGKGAPKRSAEEIEEDMVRQKYMGPGPKQSTFSASKKRKRTTEFNFDWNPDDDTTQPWNPVYQNQPTKPILSLGQCQFPEDFKKYEEWLRPHLQLIRERDPETGQQRYEQGMEEFYRTRDRVLRSGQAAHWSEKKLEDMRERDWRIFKEDYSIATKGGQIPNPMRKWDEAALPLQMLNIVESVGYHEPTPIQRAAIPIALQGRDVLGVAVTGSGKTAAFLLPLLTYIKDLPELDESNKNDGPYGLILAPTRELAQQIESEARKFCTPFGFTVVSIVGGHSLEEQSYALRNGAEIVVATPGRLVDCLERHMLVLSQCCYIIMDEADRMIDLGFEESLTKILNALPVTNEKPDTQDAEDSRMMTKYLGGSSRYRQTMMYTATMPSAVETIAKKYLRRPALVTIGNIGEAVETVEQRVEFINGEDRRKKRMQEILGSNQFPAPIIVFVNIKRNCDAVAKDIKQMGFSAVTLHGSKTQEQREAALASVRQGKTDILVATDLAGRGIDVADVSLVLNFNMSGTIESYTHRIGRTGRAGKTGVAITFLGTEDNDVLYDLKQMISKSSISKVPEELRRHESAQSKPNRHGGGGKKDTVWQ